MYFSLKTLLYSWLFMLLALGFSLCLVLQIHCLFDQVDTLNEIRMPKKSRFPNCAPDSGPTIDNFNLQKIFKYIF
jgi:hypothetical protein